MEVEGFGTLAVPNSPRCHRRYDITIDLAFSSFTFQLITSIRRWTKRHQTEVHTLSLSEIPLLYNLRNVLIQVLTASHLRQHILS